MRSDHTKPYRTITYHLVNHIILSHTYIHTHTPIHIFVPVPVISYRIVSHRIVSYRSAVWPLHCKSWAWQLMDGPLFSRSRERERERESPCGEKLRLWRMEGTKRKGRKGYTVRYGDRKDGDESDYGLKKGCGAAGLYVLKGHMLLPRIKKPR